MIRTDGHLKPVTGEQCVCSLLKWLVDIGVGHMSRGLFENR